LYYLKGFGAPVIQNRNRNFSENVHLAAAAAAFGMANVVFVDIGISKTERERHFSNCLLNSSPNVKQKGATASIATSE
jgi:hypothetical protein